MPITLVIVEDHPALRIGLRLLLEREPDFRVVGDTGRGLETADLVERLQPTVLLLDLQLPDRGGLEVLGEVQQRAPATRVLILSGYPSDTNVREAFSRGAAGFCPKTAKAKEVIAAVRTVAAGEQYPSPPRIDRGSEADAQPAPATAEPYKTLTICEREVLRLAVEAHSDAEIADLLDLDPRRVAVYRATLMQKLNVQNHADLVQQAIRWGLRQTPR